MTDISRISPRQKQALRYIARYETAEYGVIVRYVTGERLTAHGWAITARRRSFARETGICLRLTDEGRRVLRQLEGEE